MLIRFSVTNFLSFKDEVTLSMVPGKGRHHSSHILSGGKRGSLSALKAAVIYGANASGKSNLIKAMAYARDRIVIGTRPRQNIPFRPFRLDPSCAAKPSTFEFEVKVGAKAYNYGFTLDSRRVHEEWLYAITATSEKPIFERTTTAEGATEVEFSNIKFENADERAFLKFTAQGTRPNQLFLTETVERDIKYFGGVFSWFDQTLKIIFPASQLRELVVRVMVDNDFHANLEQLLTSFDTGISQIEAHNVDLGEETSVQADAISELRRRLLQINEMPITNSIDRSTFIDPTLTQGKPLLFEHDDTTSTWKVKKLKTAHAVKGENSKEIFDVEDESDGTQRLFHLIPALMLLAGEERVIFIDELDRSLHPHLSRKLLELFLNSTSQTNSQLIVTTHESHLLDLDLLRRDEIWFTEKNADGESTLYSLEEFAPRYDKDIEKGYLLGRFGAIPFIKDIDLLGWQP